MRHHVLVNENSELVAEEPSYIVQIASGSDDMRYLEYFTDPHETYPVRLQAVCSTQV